MGKKRSRRKSSNSDSTPKFSSHHLRPRSRGGADKKDKRDKRGDIRSPGYTPNEIRLHNKLMHRPLHDLFNNDRVSEILAKLIFCWDTVNPHMEENEQNTWPERLGFKKRKKAWNILFNKGMDQSTAIEHFLKEFVHTKEDEQHCSTLLSKGLKCGIISSKDYNRCLNIMKNNGNL